MASQSWVEQHTVLSKNLGFEMREFRSCSRELSLKVIFGKRYLSDKTIKAGLVAVGIRTTRPKDN